MTKKEVIVQITKEDSWGQRIIKEQALTELERAARDEGCSWGDQTISLIYLYRNLQTHCVSKKFAKVLGDEIINLYMHMLKWTEIKEYPEREEIIKRPKEIRREWNY